jgi:hypothetical protein
MPYSSEVLAPFFPELGAIPINPAAVPLATLVAEAVPVMHQEASLLIPRIVRKRQGRLRIKPLASDHLKQRQLCNSLAGALGRLAGAFHSSDFQPLDQGIGIA